MKTYQYRAAERSGQLARGATAAEEQAVTRAQAWSRRGAALQRYQDVADASGQVARLAQGAALAQAGQAAAVEDVRPNQGGLPAALRSGLEALSGVGMEHVRVHYNSAKPAQLQAHAYAQGSEIHLGPGQERHLPHEAWHIVQQARGRVRPTLRMQGQSINDDPHLEAEADAMGAQAARLGAAAPAARVAPPASRASATSAAAQRVDLTEGNYDEVKAYMQTILRQYPVSEYYYLSLGKSPTPLIAFLHAAGREAQVTDIGANLPLSKFSHKAGSSKNNGILGDALTKSQLAELHHHFDRFVPSAEQLNGRKLLLIDFVQSGRSLIAATDHLRDYLAQRYETDLFKRWTGLHGFGLAGTLPDYKPEVQPLALTEASTAHAADPFLRPENIPNEVLPGSMAEEGSLGALMGAEQFKPDAEYAGDFIIKRGDRSDDLAPSAKYEVLVRQFQEFMRRDDGMDALRLLAGA